MVSCDEVGTHPMQRLVEMVNMEEEREVIFGAIKNDIVHLAFHPKGNYVLILAIQILRGNKFDFIAEKLLDHITKLSLDQFGICIVNKILQLVQKKELIENIVEILANNITEII